MKFKLRTEKLRRTAFKSSHFALVLSAIVCGQLIGQPAFSEGQMQVRPTLRIMHPKPDQLYYDTPILVQVIVNDFKLEAPKDFFGYTEDQTIGHIHYMLDDYPLIATDQKQIMLGKNACKKPLRTGHHTLTVELVKTNHKSLSPKVIARVSFLTDHNKRKRSSRDLQEGDTVDTNSQHSSSKQRPH